MGRGDDGHRLALWQGNHLGPRQPVALDVVGPGAEFPCAGLGGRRRGIASQVAKVLLLDLESFGGIERRDQNLTLRPERHPQRVIARDHLPHGGGHHFRAGTKLAHHADVERYRLAFFRAAGKAPPHFLPHRNRQRALGTLDALDRPGGIARRQPVNDLRASAAQALAVGIGQGVFRRAVADFAIHQRQDDATAFQIGDQGRQGRHAACLSSLSENSNMATKTPNVRTAKVTKAGT